MANYPEYKNLDSISIEKGIRNYWEEHHIFEQSIRIREGHPEFIFYEGPPSANGMPGIHHVLSRTLKDIFCRYKTQKGYLVKRKAGWDTHGLPVEISVEKTLGIKKEDIGRTISVEEYNSACRKDVLKYKSHWDEITRIMGYWLDLNDPYITFENKYIESLWWLLKQLYGKGLLYKGYTIQPYSPAAGTGLSTHELNQPGCYRIVKDITAVAMFKAVRNEKSEFLFSKTDTPLYFLAWTTTPWTLPSNTALAVGANMDYVMVKTFNNYTGQPITVILAKELLHKYFPESNKELKFEDYKPGDKAIPYEVLFTMKGKDLFGLGFEQLLPYRQPEDGKAFIVVTGDFVTTEEGTGIVHIAPSFGADDMRMSKEFGLGTLTMVDRQGRFVEEMGEFAGRYVKAEYEENYDPKVHIPVDVDIVVKLKKEGKLFQTEKYEHSYPHCWRTDKPILYYPLDSWFIKTTALKERLIELNRTINWKPPSTGLGRFENWLENLVDWNLSRSRFWGTPLPIWVSEDGKERKCIGSVEELKSEIEKSVQTGFMKENPLASFKPGDFSESNYNLFDLHRPAVDDIILVSSLGLRMYREPDLIDVWFDSGAMPYAQFHYPFENQNLKDYFPADYISEGVDQTRGWFFTLHAISTMVFDSIAFKNVVSHGLVLDKNGNKMSKRVGNVVDPFKIFAKYGADATRWYMITNGQPWDNLKFDEEGIAEVRRKFLGTLYNTYAFFALYANIDGFTYQNEDIPVKDRPEIDRWIISKLNSLIRSVENHYESYEPARAGREIQDFVIDHLSNWYVRLSRRRFWKSENSNDKMAAYQTLYHCLQVVSQLMAPLAPFFSEQLFIDLNTVTNRVKNESVHLADFPSFQEELIDQDLEEKMSIAQSASSLILSLRKRQNIRVRQPLSKVLIPVLNQKFRKQVNAVSDLIMAETNVKSIELIDDSSGFVTKKVKPDFKKLGPQYGRLMKQLTTAISEMNQKEITQFEQQGQFRFTFDGQEVIIHKEDVEILSEDIPGWLVTNDEKLTVALDINITPELFREGIAREIVNRIQNLRKSKGFDVTDHIEVIIEKESRLEPALIEYKNYICSETLASNIELREQISENDKDLIEIDDIRVNIRIKKC